MDVKVLHLVGAEARRQWIEMRRYPVETVSSVVTLLLVFVALFLGARYLSGGPVRGTRLSSVVIGYGVWALCMAAIGEMGFSLQNEAQNGTLEQLFLSPWQASEIMLVRAVMGTAAFLVPLAAILGMLVVITGARFTFSPSDLVPTALSLVTAWGLGLAVAVAAVLFKRMGQVLNMLQFVLIFVIMAPVPRLDGFGPIVAAVLPLTAPVALLNRLMVTGPGAQPMWLFGVEATANALVYLGGGLWLFRRADALARKRGILSHY